MKFVALASAKQHFTTKLRSRSGFFAYASLVAAVDPVPPEYITAEEEFLKGERLVKPFAYRLSPQGVMKVSKTLHPGDYPSVHW